jgi:DNA-binding transcriptional regulator LsrR (DeoR family)
MDSNQKDHAVDALKHLGMMKEEGEISLDSPARANDLIKKLAEALRRTAATAPACPYCETPTYLRRHQAGCGINQVLEEAKDWLERQP